MACVQPPEQELYRRQLGPITEANRDKAPTLADAPGGVLTLDHVDGRRYISGTTLSLTLPAADLCRGMRSAFLADGTGISITLQPAAPDSVWRSGVKTDTDTPTIAITQADGWVILESDGFRWLLHE